MSACVRNTAAIAMHELRSFAVNPSVLATIAVLLLFCTLFVFLGFYRWFTTPFLCQTTVCSIGFIGTICIAAEEREQGAFITLSYAGISPVQLAIGKMLTCTVLAEATAFTCTLIVEADAVAALTVSACMLASTIPVAIFSAATGLQLNDQQRASLWGSLPLVVGTLASAGQALWNAPFWLVPLGAAPELIAVFQYGDVPAADPAITIAVGLAYAGLCAIGLRKSVKRFAQTNPCDLR